MYRRFVIISCTVILLSLCGCVQSQTENVTAIKEQNTLLLEELAQKDITIGQLTTENDELKSQLALLSNKELRVFNNTTELREFLKYDKTNEMMYSVDFDCDSYAMMLSKNAYDKGYYIGIYTENNHMKNIAIVGSSSAYLIEPQTDAIVGHSGL